MIITQPDRYLLIEQIAAHADRLTGDLLDIGAGRHRRYASLFHSLSSYRTLDVRPEGKPDILGSAESIPLPDASVDSILCTQVLEHVPHPQTALREMYRVLRSGGRCLLTVPQMNELHEKPHDFFRYTCWGLQVMFEDAGFRVEAMDQRGKYFSMMAQLRIRRLIGLFHPYEHRIAMLLLAPLTKLMTHWSIFRDRFSQATCTSDHAIGWCVLAIKP